MPRKAVTRRLDLIRRLRTFLHASGPTLDRHLTGRPAAAGDGTLSYLPVFQHFRAELVAVERRLEAAEEAYDLAQAEVRLLREERDQIAQEHQDRHSSILRLLRGFLGQRALERLGIDSAAFRTVPELLMQARRTLRILTDLGTAAPPHLAELELETTALAARLEAGLLALEAGQDAIETADLAVTHARSQANDAVATTDRVAPWVARALENLCGLAGECRLADRVRGR